MDGLVRTSKKWVFVSENYIITGGDESFGILSGGFRYMGKRIAIDFGLFLPIVPDVGSTFTFPWLSISAPFGKRY